MLLLSCADQRGLVAAVANFIAEHGGNILHADQHLDVDEDDRKVFFQRVEFELDGFDAASATRSPRRSLRSPSASACGPRCASPTGRCATAILASRQPHCLADLLVRWSSGELPCDVRVVVANHPDHAALCAGLGAPFVHLPVTDDGRQEDAVLATLADHDVELVVLARYMRILSPAAIARYPNRIINIHHSFLPAFAGANPYRQAHDRGVKLIGATAHYATDELDEGPIIDQETARVSHRDDVARLTRAGRDLETTVLARAVRAHLDHRVLVHGRKTVVF